MQNYFRTKKNHTIRITAHDWYSKDVSYIGQYDGRKLPLSSGGGDSGGGECPCQPCPYLSDYIPKSEVEANYVSREEVDSHYFPLSSLDAIREEISAEICAIITSSIEPTPQPPDPETTYFKVSVVPSLTGSETTYQPMKTTWCLSGTVIDETNANVFLPSQTELTALNPDWEFVSFNHDLSVESFTVDMNVEILAIYDIKEPVPPLEKQGSVGWSGEAFIGGGISFYDAADLTTPLTSDGFKTWLAGDWFYSETPDLTYPEGDGWERTSLDFINERGLTEEEAQKYGGALGENPDYCDGWVGTTAIVTAPVLTTQGDPINYTWQLTKGSGSLVAGRANINPGDNILLIYDGHLKDGASLPEGVAAVFEIQGTPNGNSDDPPEGWTDPINYVLTPTLNN